MSLSCGPALFIWAHKKKDRDMEWEWNECGYCLCLISALEVVALIYEERA
jgi:hypothetical protein